MSSIEYRIKIYKKEPIPMKKPNKLDSEIILLPDFQIEDPIPERLKENHVLVQVNPFFIEKIEKFHALLT